MKKIIKSGLLFLGFLLWGSTLWAIGHGTEGATAAAEWKDFFWRCVNFILFLGIIYKLAGNRIKDFFGGRTKEIENKFQTLEKRRKEAERKLKDVEARIANLEQERQEILEEAKAQGEAIKNAIIERAYKEAEEIKKQAEIKAQQEFEQAIEMIRGEMADRIIESAEKIIQKRLGVKEQEHLIDKYITKVVFN